MKAKRTLLAAAAICIASAVGAQPATYDAATGMLTIPSVTVGTTTYGGVKLQNTGDHVAGTITPRSRGNLYDITVPFGAGCDFSGQTFTGIVFLDALTQRLMVAALNAQRSVAGMFIATR